MGSPDERRRSRSRSRDRSRSRSSPPAGEGPPLPPPPPFPPPQHVPPLPPPRGPPQGGPPGGCFQCGAPDHWARECPAGPLDAQRLGGGRGSGRGGGRGGGGRGGGGSGCFKCGASDHWSRECPGGGGGGGTSVAGALRDRLGGGGADDGDWGAPGGGGQDRPPPVEVEPDFGLSGVLAAETNTVSGVTLVHSEPPEARMPTKRWRLYVFKGEAEAQPPLMLHTASSYLIGRERKVAAIPTDHLSCSKQHAVLQWRRTEKEGPDGMRRAAVRPYIMDLGSTNGTFLNGDRLEAQKYVELLHQDALRFGSSSREFVLICDDAARKPN